MLAERKKQHPNDTYVFQVENGMPLNPNLYTARFRRLIKRVAKKLKIELNNVVLHDLRHNYATQLVAQNVHIRLIQQQLGHARLTSTQRYAHAYEQGQQEAAQKMNAVLQRIKPRCSTVAVQVSEKAIKS
jgi:site-specific recombinase XerD